MIPNSDDVRDEKKSPQFCETNKDDNGTTTIQIYQKSLPHTIIHIIIYGYTENT